MSVKTISAVLFSLWVVSPVFSQNQIEPYWTDTSPSVNPAPGTIIPAPGTPYPSQPYPSQPYPGSMIPGNGFPNTDPNFIPPVVNPNQPIYQDVGVTNQVFDQFGRPLYVGIEGQVIRESALNAGRNQAQPGTTRYVDRTEIDSMGRQVRVTGYEWIGLDGQPHGNLNRQLIGVNSQGTVIESNIVESYGAPVPVSPASSNGTPY